MRLPRSYRSFVQRYGYGLTAGLFIIYVPTTATGCDSLVGRSAELREELEVSVRGNWVQFAPDGSRELVLRLMPFGYSENANILAWDPTSPSEPEEFWIYVVGSRKSGIRKAAPNLSEFVRRILEPGVGGILGRADFQLEATFDPWDLPPAGA